MKEIKFRAWSKEEGMINVARLDIADGSLYKRLITGKAYDYWNDVILMQYTGLKDKNGTEIYEGDIVKYTSELENGIFEVKYGCCRFYGLWIEATFMDITTDLFYLGCSNELEVIGNIYKNPELLEVN
ncbi:MAG: YopX family protein [Clostridium butyricum]